MTTYRTGNHWGVTIVREPTLEAGSNLEQVGRNSELVAVVVNGDTALAERICALLSDRTPVVDYLRGAAEALAHVRRLLDRAYPGLKETTAWVTRHAAAELGVDENGPSAPLSSPVSAERPPAGGSGRAEPATAVSGGCDCGHEGLAPMFHLRPCPIAERRFAKFRAQGRPRHGEVS